MFLVPKAKRKLLLSNELPEKRINQTLLEKRRGDIAVAFLYIKIR